MAPNEILTYFESRTEAVVASIREIVDIESPSYDAPRSRAVVDWIEKAFRDTGAGLQVQRVPAEGYGDHIIVRAFPGEMQPVLLIGHSDTVHPVGAKDRNPTRVENDKLFGCGVFDMKANIVLMIEAIRFFEETGIRPARPITVVISCDEEVGSATGRPLIEQEAEHADHCFVFEPSSNGSVKTGRKGTGMYTLRAHGIPAHAGLEPEKGASAILEIARQIGHLQTFNAPDLGTTVNVCTAAGGTTTNVIPEFAQCTVDVRFSSLNEAERVYEEIYALKPFDERVTLEILGSVNRPPLERTPAVISLFEKARNAAASFGYDLGETQVGGASDGNFVAALGVPVLDGLGIKGDGAHTLQEHILVSDIAKRATLVTSLLAA
ncbi:MAG: carboxypeptidase [Acidobacteria bacterium]|nr:MAG: carboxypeptidase [Acidobacteriota bacterium]